jgi:hypothetical protein
MTSPNGSRINIFSKKNFENIQAGLKQRGLLFHNLQTSEQYALKSEGRKGFLGLSVYSSWVDKVEVSGRNVIITTKSGKSYTTPLKNNEE